MDALMFAFTGTDPVNNTAVQLALVMMSSVSIGALLVAVGVWRRRNSPKVVAPSRMQNLIGQLTGAIDSESVSLFQWVYYVVFLLSGVYNLFIADTAPLTLYSTMGPVSLRLWYWLNIFGSALPLIGKAVRRTNLAYVGMWLQLFGNLTMYLVLLAYVVATMQVESWGRGGYGAFLGVAVLLAVTLIVIRDIRRLIEVEQRL
jgi:hypothetical protein